jgi:hypothetical protein
MNLRQSMITLLRDRARAYAVAHFAPELRREEAHSAALRSEVMQWRRWSTRLVLAERWARGAAEHDPDSPWRPVLSAYAMRVLLTTDLGELEIELGERAKWAEQFARDPETQTLIATPEQQVGLIFNAMWSELIAAKGEKTRHFYDPIGVEEGDPQAPMHHRWDRQRLAKAGRDLVISATNQAITIATQRLGLTPTHSVSPEA